MKTSLQRRSVFATLAALLAVGNANAEWKAPYNGLQLGGRLEKVYADVLSGCGLPTLEAGKWVKTRISAVPEALQRSLPMNDDVAWIDNVALARQFAMVYPANAEFGKPEPQLANQLLYSEDLTQAADGMLWPGTGSVIHRHDCSTIVSAAFDAGLEIPLTLAQVKTMLKTAQESSRKASIMLAHGNFQSPLLTMWKPTAKPQEQVQVIMSLFDWYRNVTPSTGQRKLLASLQGATALFTALEQQRTGSYEVSADFQTNVDVATAGFRSTVTSKQVGKTTVTNFVVAARQGKDYATFVPLPSVNELAQRLAALSTALETAEDTPAVPGTKVQHTQVMKGIAPAFCDQTQPMWDIDSTDANVKLAHVKPVVVATVPACSFTVEYTVPSSYGSSMDTTFQLNYGFVTRQAIQDGTSGPVRLRLPAAPVRYAINKAPYVFPTNVPEKPDFADNTGSLIWTGSLLFRDDTKLVDWIAPASADMKLSCNGTAPVPVSGDIAINPTTQLASIRIRYDAQDDAEYTSWKKSTGFRNCTLLGSVTVGARPLGTHVRPFTVRVQVPNPVQVAAAVPPAETAIAKAD